LTLLARWGSTPTVLRDSSSVREVAAAAVGALISLGVAAPARAEPPGPLFHPDGPGELRLRAGAGALVDILPRQTVESELRTIPQLTSDARFGLPSGFFANARLRAIVLTNQLELGGGWSHRVGDFSFGVLDHFGVWYGVVNLEGFDTTAWGYLNQPGVSVGVPMGDVRFSLTVEGIVMLAQHVRLGDTTHVSRQNVSLAGGQATLIVENFVGDRGDLYYGVAAMYAEPDYQAWIAFSDSRSRLWYPRLLAGYAF
jgi:hypothetical protein